MATTVPQPLKWHGGKNYLARWISGLMPPHVHYVEPYFGGGAVLLARDPDDERLWLPPHQGVSEVVNDLNGHLSNFWRVLQDEAMFEQLRRRLEATPFSGVEYERATDMLPDVDLQNDVERAWAFFVYNRQSLAGRMAGFTGVTKTRTRARMNNEVSAWLSCIAGLPEVHARLRRVLILPPQPALRVIEKQDTLGTLFYLDPPYLHETRSTTGEYAHEMSETDHQQLLETLRGIQGKFLLSGYPSSLYDEIARANSWKRHDYLVPNHAASGPKKEQKTECVWANF